MNKDYSVLDGIIRNATSELKTAFDKGYAQGVENTTNELQGRENDRVSTAFRDGKIWAIRVVKWLFQHAPDKELFNGDYVEDIINQHDIDEIYETINDYYGQDITEQQTYRYGDEIRRFSDGKLAIVICRVGSAGDVGMYRVIIGDDVACWGDDNFAGTGRHFDAITEDLIRELKGGDVNDAR